MSNYSLIYVTCGTKEEAQNIILSLLEEKLIACGNLFPAVTSFFHWEGKIDKSEEVVMILKTKTKLFSKVEPRIVELHSYEVPCIVKIEADYMHAPFANWIEETLK
ncbi:MAG TPA: divalent-cation tolerance protein CutA [Alphaproteobacteria bacterium]|nr:divalent-cation tolerance protein CutA [Alphaproteobacteria bacterium]HOO51355.1 divalent-cation tolerance protein CutA [Alphaproteobacteria bacterium]